MPEHKTFWMVWSPKGRSPTHRHDTLDSARTEAERLARNNVTQEFYVLVAVSKSMKIDVETIALVPPEYAELDQIPF